MRNRLTAIPLDRSHGGNPPENCVDFSTSVNPLGPPVEALRAYHDAVAQISAYPSPYSHRLERRIAAWLSVDPAMVIAANGSTQLLYLAARVLRLSSPFVVIPTFSEIANALLTARVKPFPILLRCEDNFRLEVEALHDALEAGADGLFLGRPNSPTGTLPGLDQTAAIARECAQRDAWCVIDEAFIEFADDPRSVCSLIGSIPKLLVLRSLTKIFAIPGLRLGYMVGPPEVVHKLREALEPWSVNTVAEHVALACLEAAEPFIARTRALIARERPILENGMRRLGITVFPSAANFLMLSLATEENRGEFSDYLRSQGVVIRDLATLPGCGPGFYRIAVRLPVENIRLLNTAASYLGDRG
jgi:threonine-phosphate decarboxylase